MARVIQTNDELIKLGFSKNQSVIYMTLVAHGELRIQEITNLTKIPRSSVYENLKTLYELGLAEEIVEDNFKKVRPYPLSSMRHSLQEKIVQLQVQSKTLSNLEKQLNILVNRKPDLPTVVRFYRGVIGARQLFWNSLKAKNTVYVYSAWGRPEFVGKKFYMDFVKESYARKIKEKVLVNPSARVLASIGQNIGPPFRRTRIEDIRALDEAKISIKGETLIYNNIYAQVYLDTGVINGFEIESDSFTDTQRSIFETLSTMAKPVSALL